MSRETEELTREVLARKRWTKVLLANQIGVDYDEVCAWLEGKSEPSLEQVDRMGRLLER